MEQPHLQLGPFQGITDVWFRKSFQSYFSGIDRFFTPFFSGIDTEKSKSLSVAEIDPTFNDTTNLIPQLLSNNADEVIRFSRQTAEKGYSLININMGCPSSIVTRKKRGSGLLPYPELIQNMTQKLSVQIGHQYSIKCRLGYLNQDEIDELIPIFNAARLDQLIIHARIGKQMYKGVPNFEKFDSIRESIHADLIYNGDIFSVENYNTYQKMFPDIAGWMLGRGLLSDPFLAQDIKSQTENTDKNNRLYIVQNFVEELYYLRRKHTNDNLNILGRMKELWSYLRFSFSNEQEVWRLIRKTTSFDAYEDAVAEVFRSNDWEGVGYSKKAVIEAEQRII